MNLRSEIDVQCGECAAVSGEKCKQWVGWRGEGVSPWIELDYFHAKRTEALQFIRNVEDLGESDGTIEKEASDDSWPI